MIVLRSGIIVEVLEEHYSFPMNQAMDSKEVKYELKVSSPLTLADASEFLHEIIPFTYGLRLKSLIQAHGRATVIAVVSYSEHYNRVISGELQNLSFKGNKYFFAKKYGEYDETNAVIIIEDHGDNVICLFADGKRRLIPKDVLDLNLTV